MEIEEYERMAQVEGSHWWYGQTRALLQEVLGPHLVANGRFLDAGAGTGATGAWMSEYGQVCAVDLEPFALRLYGQQHPDASRCVSDLVALPLQAASFDAVLAVTVLYHRAVEPNAAVAELVRVTTPGGVICLMEPGVRRLRRAHDRVTHTGRRFCRHDLAELLVESGCDVVKSTGAYSFLVPPAAVKAMLERGRMSSDLDGGGSRLAGPLKFLARCERAVLTRVNLPFGLSVVAIGRKR